MFLIRAEAVDDAAAEKIQLPIIMNQVEGRKSSGSLVRGVAALGAATVTAIFLLHGCSLAAEAAMRGGELVYAQSGSPPTLDPMSSSSALTRNISLNIFEMLMTRDARGEPATDLLERVDVTTDRLQYLLELKRGVLFHNGQEMTATDVVASINRYIRVGFDQRILRHVSRVVAESRYSVSISLGTPDPNFIRNLSSPRAPLVIMPATEAAKSGEKLQLIGTGPFAFKEWVPDAYILLERFEGYRPRTLEHGPNGLTGAKIAYVDSVRIRTIPEMGAQLAALQSGEIDLLKNITNQSAERLRKGTAIKTYLQMPSEMFMVTLNAGFGATENLEVRRAIQAALDCREIMEIATDGVYRLNHSFNYPESPHWSEGFGQRLYNQANSEKAKLLLRESGYRDEEVVIVAHTASNAVYRASVVLYEQLRKIGLNVRLLVVDFPRALSLIQRRGSWNIWVNNFGIGPWLGATMLPRYWVGKSGFQNKADPMLDDLYATLIGAKTDAERRHAASELQDYMYRQAYTLKLGDAGTLLASGERVNGFSPYMIMRFWGIWLEPESIQ